MTKEALKLALEALEGADMIDCDMRDALTAIKEALAQPEQPKVRTGDCLLVGVCASEGHKIAPQRTWVDLTDEETETLIHRFDGDPHTLLDEVNARLKEKNT